MKSAGSSQHLQSFTCVLLALHAFAGTYAEGTYPEDTFQPLNCVSCSPGLFLHQDTLNCTACPAGSSTFVFTNASSELDCLCKPGFENLSSSVLCSQCLPGFFKDHLANVSCDECLPHSSTPLHGSDHVEDCLCEPGFTKTDPADHGEFCVPCGAGSYKTELSDAVCDVCPADAYCPAQSILPTPCPANSSSAPGSGVITECLCQPGFYKLGDGASYHCQACAPGTFNADIDVATCEDCPANTFNALTASSSNAACLPCDANAASTPASTALTDCLCNLGYAGIPGAACSACEPGTYRKDTASYICVDCPPHTYNVDFAADHDEHCRPCQADTQSAAGSGVQRGCVCNAGFFGSLQPAAGDAADLDSGGELEHDRHEYYPHYVCAACAQGTFSTDANSSSCDLCAAGKFSASVGASSAETCTLCDSGSFTLTAGRSTCELCAVDFWQDVSVPGHTALACSACPTNSSHAITGSYDVNDCLCAAGFKRTDVASVFECADCVAGYYCPHSGTMEPCAFNHFSVAGITTACTACAATVSEAVTNSALLTSPDMCQCVAGAEGTAHTDCALCEPGKFQSFDYTYDGADHDGTTHSTLCLPCAVDTFQPATGATACTACTGNSSTQGTGHVLGTACHCDPGFVGDDGAACAACAAGKFCPGRASNPSCRVFSTSAPRSVSQHDCVCKPGHYSLQTNTTCHKCNPGTFCPGGLAHVSCAGHSSSRAGSKRVEDCTCASGYWRGCVQNADGSYVNSTSKPCEIVWSAPCVQCGPNDICVNDTLLHCPDDSSSPAGSSKPEHCVCDDGFYEEWHED